MPVQVIKISGARQHNLKNLHVEIPREKFVVITGLRDSGKSSLAFDTLHAEGQRRYVEGLSAYAQQFLDTRNQRLKRALLYDRYLTQLAINCQWNQHEQIKTANGIQEANVALHSIFRARKFTDGGCQN